MPRPQFNESRSNPYHLAARCNNREWYTLPMSVVWDIMGRYLYLMHHAYGVRIHGFVLMTNHFHLLASFPNGGVALAMQYFMRETTRSIAREAHRINHVYGSRYFRSEIVRYHHFNNVYKYVYRNPVEVGACARAEDYPWSTLHGLLGRRRLIIPVEEDTLLFGDLEEALSWLNRAPRPSARDAMKAGLRRMTFALPLSRTTKKKHPLEHQRY